MSSGCWSPNWRSWFCWSLNDFRTGEPPACSYLEKILSKNLELMERRLMDYLDERLRALQEHVDGKVALLAHLLQSPGSPPPGMPLTRYDSGDRLSNGER